VISLPLVQMYVWCPGRYMQHHYGCRLSSADSPT
jgi:hypothetical protein